MRAELEDLLDEADGLITHPNRNPKNLCDIFEEVTDLTDCANQISESEYRYRMMMIAKLMEDAKLFGEFRLASRMEMLEALNRNGFWKCPKCGWVKVTTVYHSHCSVCGRAIHQVHGIWRTLPMGEQG
jgi:rubrerythrin